MALCNMRRRNSELHVKGRGSELSLTAVRRAAWKRFASGAFVLVRSHLSSGLVDLVREVKELGGRQIRREAGYLPDW